MKTMIRLLSMALCLIMIFTFVSCNNTNSDTKNDGTLPSDTSESEQKGERTVTDHNGNIIKLPDEINRIVVCDIYPLPSVLALFFDSAEKIVGIPKQSMTAAAGGLLGELYPELLKAETGYINGTQVNIEEVMSLEPDIAFYSADDKPMGETLSKAGIPAVAISASKWEYNAIETLDMWISLLSQIFPENDKAEYVRQYSDDILKLVEERTSTVEEKEKVFFLFQYGDTNITTSGKHFFGEWWASAVNAVNVGGEMDTVNSTAVSMEQIYVWNPDRILITNYNTAQPDDIYGNTVGNYDWSGISAVKNGKVSKMPLGMYRSYTCGVDAPITLLWMAKTVYPELFEDIDITVRAQEYYRDLFGVELSKEQIERIFAPSSDASAFVR